FRAHVKYLRRIARLSLGSPSAICRNAELAARSAWSRRLELAIFAATTLRASSLDVVYAAKVWCGKNVERPAPDAPRVEVGVGVGVEVGVGVGVGSRSASGSGSGRGRGRRRGRAYERVGTCPTILSSP